LGRRPFSAVSGIRTRQAENLPDHLGLSELAIHTLCHEFLGTVVQDELKDQALKGFGDIFFVISGFGCVKPISVDDKDGGKLPEQGHQGSVKGMCNKSLPFSRTY
jgi:hypothetical protein